MGRWLIESTSHDLYRLRLLVLLRAVLIRCLLFIVGFDNGVTAEVGSCMTGGVLAINSYSIQCGDGD